MPNKRKKKTNEPYYFSKELYEFTLKLARENKVEDKKPEFQDFNPGNLPKEKLDTIKSICDSQITQLSYLISNPEINQFIKENAYLAGGFIRDVLRDKSFKDVDIYFKKEIPQEYIKKLTKEFKISQNGTILIKNFQLITILFGEPKEVVSKFDFTINNNFYDYQNKVIYYETIENELVVNPGVFTPLSCGMRVLKFLNKGYTIDKEQWATVLLSIYQINNKNFTKAEVAKQLYTGSSDYNKVYDKALKNLRKGKDLSVRWDKPFFTEEELRGDDSDIYSTLVASSEPGVIPTTTISIPIAQGIPTQDLSILQPVRNPRNSEEND